jgi:hypothetical protein
VVNAEEATMRAHVIYESMYGNTQSIAEAVAEGLRDAGVRVELTEVGSAPGQPDPLTDLLVVGGPTHAFGLSRPGTRESAAEQAHRRVISAHLGIREWLDDLPAVVSGVAAAFDTHIDKRWVPGSAARSAARRLEATGYRLAAPAESFFVRDSEGPLKAGEVARARRWGRELAAAAIEAQRLLAHPA